MRKRDIFWILILLLIGWAYVHFFTSVGVTKTIPVYPSLRPVANQGGGGGVFPVYFTFDKPYSLTSVEVTIKQTNQNLPAHVLWHLVASEGSDEVKFFSYGQNVNGMDTDAQSPRTEPLQPDVIYHIEVASGKTKGGSDFKTKAVPN